MAIDNQFGKGIGLAAGFDLGAQKPLDSRIAVNTIEERDAHVTNNRAYEGMLVFVDAEKKTYQLINGQWVVFFDNVANEEGAEEQAAKDQQQDDRLQALENKVGKDINGEDAATGLFLEVDEAKAAAQAAQKAADDEAARAAEIEEELQAAIDAINDDENGILILAKNHAEEKDGVLKEGLEGKIAEVQGAVDTEKGRAEGEEAKLQQAINAINNADTGILKQAKDHADNLDVQVRADIKTVTDGHAGRIETLEGEMDDAQEDIEELLAFKAAVSAGDVEINLKDVDERIAALEADAPLKQAAIEAAQGAANKAQGEVDVLEGVVAQEVQDRKDAVAAVVEQLGEDKAELQGNIDKEVQDRKDAVKAVEDEIAKQKDAAQAGTLAYQIAAEKSRAEGKEGELLEAINQEVADRGEAIQGVMDALADEADERQAVADALADQMDVAVEGSLAKQIANEKARAEEAEGDLEERIIDIENAIGAGGDLEVRVKANEDAIDVINGEGEGSIKKAVADLVDGAPEALNTLNELAAALRDNANVLDAVETAFDNKLDAQKQALQKEIDDDVKVVADELAKQKDAEQTGSLANQIKVEKARAEKAESDLEERILANEAFVAAQPNKDAAQNDRIKALEDANAEGGAMKEAVDAAQAAADAAQNAADAAQGAADAAQADVDAIEGRLDNEGGLVDRLVAAEGFIAAQPAINKAQQDAIDDHAERIVDLETFKNAHSHEAIEKGIADNKAAIEKEVEDRDAAIAEALKDYTNTEDLKTMLSNVVATLDLSIVDNKMVLKLGGAEGVTLSEDSLDMADNDDIDAIIAGLDAE